MVSAVPGVLGVPRVSLHPSKVPTEAPTFIEKGDNQTSPCGPIQSGTILFNNPFEACKPSLRELVVEEHLGNGGMAEVFRARFRASDPELHPLAIKTLKDWTTLNSLRRFEREIMLMWKTRNMHGIVHPKGEGLHVMQGYKRFIQPFIAMDLIDGGTLKKKVNSHDSLTPMEEIAIIGKICASVKQLHEYRDEEGKLTPIIHRDLKPDNVLLDENNNPIIIDFGLSACEDYSHRLDTHAVKEYPGSLTRAEAVIGTPDYMAPEQASGLVGVHPETVDTYALGTMLYEILTGHLPFDGKTVTEVLTQKQYNPPVHIKDRPLRSQLSPMSDEFVAAVMKALERNPFERIELGELQSNIERYVGSNRVTYSTEVSPLEKQAHAEDEPKNTPTILQIFSNQN